ncbi:hypothetical protein LEN26_000587 [Aphanomyces euteiches]|nr:hypothetical protein AeMF1_001460 [Aphanomyces euteiches]KAH9163215.1 hypothetical protein LEN26_000587 [Aphanomyces euteiches]KAH9193431.1 hypothetical protein AeNC1_004582 [Aphanomyces euteiches]
MELDTFLQTQPWLEYDERATQANDVGDTFTQLESSFFGMFLVNEHSFCTFAPTHGDQTQFECIFYLQESKKRDANGDRKSPTQLCLRINSKMYWMDHKSIQKPPTVVNQPSMPANVLFELGPIRFRVWADLQIPKEEQVARINRLLHRMSSNLNVPSIRPAFPGQVARVKPSKTPLELFQQHINQDDDSERTEKLHLFSKICLDHGVDPSTVLDISQSRNVGLMMSTMLQCKELHMELDTIFAIFGLAFSETCSAHDDCFQLSTQTGQCTTSLWHNWESYLDATELSSSEGSIRHVLEERTQLFRSSMVSSARRSDWADHARHVRLHLRECETSLWSSLFPSTFPLSMSDDLVHSNSNLLHSIKQAKKKLVRDELAILLLPGSR